MGGLEGAGGAAPALRTFLIADVRGYTRYTQEQGDEEPARLAARFAELARRGIESHVGELLELHGDEALGVFASAREALRAAVALQRLFRERTDGTPALALGVGIGLDAGEAVPVEGGYRGGALNLAARLCSRAAPGEILTSETVVSLARPDRGHPLRGARRRAIEGPRRAGEGDRGRPRDGAAARAGVALGIAPPPPPQACDATEGVERRRDRHRRGRGRHARRRGARRHERERRGSHSGRARRPVSSVDQSAIAAQVTEGLLRAERTFDVETETIGFDEFDTSPKALEQVRTRIEDGDFDLVLWASGGPVTQALIGEVAKYPDTQFAYVDSFLEGSGLEGAPNASAFFLLDGSASYLAGYLSALVSKSGKVSVVGGIRDVRRAVGALVRGRREDRAAAGRRSGRLLEQLPRPAGVRENHESADRRRLRRGLRRCRNVRPRGALCGRDPRRVGSGRRS